MSTSLVMDGYDLKLIGSLFAQPAFSEAYGHRQPDGTYQIPAPWQSGLNNGSNVGQLMGLLLAGVLSERFGFRKTMMGALVVVPCFIFIQFFASTLPQLQVGQILIGTVSVQSLSKLESLTFGHRCASWNISNCDVCVCHRSNADLPACVSYQLCQRVLAARTVHCSWHAPRHPQYGSAMGISHTLRSTVSLAYLRGQVIRLTVSQVVLAYSSATGGCICSGKSLVVGSPKPHRRRQSFYDPPHLRRKRFRFRHRQECGAHGPYNSA